MLTENPECLEVFVCHICGQKFYDKDRYLDHTYGLENIRPKKHNESSITAILKGVGIGNICFWGVFIIMRLVQ